MKTERVKPGWFSGQVTAHAPPKNHKMWTRDLNIRSCLFVFPGIHYILQSEQTFNIWCRLNWPCSGLSKMRVVKWNLKSTGERIKFWHVSLNLVFSIIGRKKYLQNKLILSLFRILVYNSQRILSPQSVLQTWKSSIISLALNSRFQFHVHLSLIVWVFGCSCTKSRNEKNIIQYWQCFDKLYFMIAINHFSFWHSPSYDTALSSRRYMFSIY